MTNWKTVHDTREERPPELDDMSSQYTVYERRNIRREEVDTGMGEPSTQWVYEQMEYGKEEYALLTGPQTANIMQTINEQTASTSVAVMIGNATAQETINQAINAQTADIVAAIINLMGGKS